MEKRNKRESVYSKIGVGFLIQLRSGCGSQWGATGASQKINSCLPLQKQEHRVDRGCVLCI